MNVYGYVRVSSRDQNEDRQLIALKEVGVPEKNIYLDKLVERNKNIILVNANAKDMNTYNAQNLRAVYYWAKMNGYNTIWQPKKKIGV